MSEIISNIDTSSNNSDSTHRYRRLLLRLGSGILIVTMLATTILVLGVYRLGWEGGIAKELVSIIPLPAGKAGDVTISCKSLFSRVDLIKHSQSNSKGGAKVAFNQLAEGVYLKLYASANHLVVDRSAVDQLKNAIQRSSDKSLDAGELRIQSEETILRNLISNDLRTSQTGQKLADQRVASVLANLDKENSTSSPLPTASQKATPGQASSGIVLVPIKGLPPEVQVAFKKLKLGQSTEKSVPAPQGFFVGKYVKNDPAGNPLFQYAIILPTLDQWLQSQHINRSQHGYLSQIK